MKYLKILDNIPDPPKNIYYRGKLPNEEPRPKTVAIVGSRRNTAYGEMVTRSLVKELVREEVVIVSGLAYGIDSIAHRACLESNGRTIAVLGTNIDRIYPTAHRTLALRIQQHGAIISEYAPGETIYPKTSFLVRNRLISGLSDIIVVIEAAERSGTLSTAAHALNQGKELFAVPGDITRPNSIGCNHLLAQGAHVYNKPEDVINLLFPRKKRPSNNNQLPLGENEIENKLIAMIAQGIFDGEEIANQLGISTSKFNQTITMLELRGIVRAMGFNRWSLVC